MTRAAHVPWSVDVFADSRRALEFLLVERLARAGACWHVVPGELITGGRTHQAGVGRRLCAQPGGKPPSSERPLRIVPVPLPRLHQRGNNRPAPSEEVLIDLKPRGIA